MLRYKVIDNKDPYVAFDVFLDTARFNALRITVSCPSYQDASLYWTVGAQKKMEFSDANCKQLGPQGVGEKGSETLLIYLENGTDFWGSVTSLRIDLGTEIGQEIAIYSIEAIWIETDFIP